MKNNSISLSLKSVITDELKELLNSFKSAPGEIKTAFADFFSFMPKRSKKFFTPYSARQLLITFLSTVIIALLLSLLCSLKEGGLDLFMTAMIPFILMSMTFFVFMIFYESSLPYAAATVVLILFGFAFQTMLKLPSKQDVVPTVTSLVINSAIGLFCGLIAIPVLYCILTKPDKKIICLALLAFSGALYLLLLAVGPDISGTRAWLIIGGRSFQITEITKVLAVTGIAVSFTNKNTAHLTRLFYSLLTLAVHAGFLVIINELGTLVVIFIVFCVLGFAYMPKIKSMVFTLLLGLTAAALLIGASRYCYYICYEKDEITSQETELTDAQDEADNTVEEVTRQEPNKIIKKAANIYYKIKLRIVLVVDPDSVDQYGDGYQSAMARRALWVTNWFGTNEEFEQHVPVIESDYIFLYVLMKIGIAGALLILFLLIFMMFETVLKTAGSRYVSESALSIGFTCCIVVQSVITAASSVGLIPTVGLTFAFLSDGGSATVVNYVMSLFILFAMRKQLPPAQIRTEIKKAERRGPVCRNTISE